MARLPLALLIVAFAGDALTACHTKREVVLGQRVPKGCGEKSTVDNEECVGFWLDTLLRVFSLRDYQDPAIDRYVSAVGKRLARATGDRRPWKFVVLDDPGVQAFVTLGSTVYIYRGTLAVLRDEAELAAVLAHEMGHLRGGHARERWAELGRGVVRSQFEQSMANRYARDDEIQADEHAVLLLSRAGYRPRAVATMLAALGGTTYDSASDQDPDDVHPWWPERIARAQNLIASRADRGELGADRYRAHVRSLIVGEDPRRIAVVGKTAVFANARLALDLPVPGTLDDREIELALPGAVARIELISKELVSLFEKDRSATVGVESRTIVGTKGGDQALLIIVRGTDATVRARSLRDALRPPRADEVASLRPLPVDLDAPRRLWSH